MKRSWWVLLPLVLAACASNPPPEPEILLTPAEMGGDFLVRQQLEGDFEGRIARFEAAMQKVGDELTVIGLTPFGTKAFVLTQKGETVAFQSMLPPDHELPLHPKYLLADIQHAFFARIPAPGAEGEQGALPDGEHTGALGGETVWERWEGGRVRERVFRVKSGLPSGEVRVTYEGGMADGVPPRVVKLVNGLYGYSITIETLVHQWLE